MQFCIQNKTSNNMKYKIVCIVMLFNIFQLNAQNVLTPTNKTNFITATISDPSGIINFKASEILCRNKNVGTKKGFTLGGFTKDRYFTISIPQNPAVGVYKIEGNSLKNFADYYIKTNGVIGYKTGKCEDAFGVIEITSVKNNKIKGTFSFTARRLVGNCNTENTRKITNGVFETTFLNE
jgi:hypothetical protein